MHVFILQVDVITACEVCWSVDFHLGVCVCARAVPLSGWMLPMCVVMVLCGDGDSEVETM